MSDIPDLADVMPFAATLGVRLIAADKDEVTGEFDWQPDRTTGGGVLHGGAIMALADSVGAVCAVLNLPIGATTSTTSSTTQFLRAVRGGTVTAVARPLHVGRTNIVVRTSLIGDDGRLAAEVTQTQAVLAARA
jgi:1,4-dihydroxy-2-naphthoyl-CoA hydrolase